MEMGWQWVIEENNIDIDVLYTYHSYLNYFFEWVENKGQTQEEHKLNGIILLGDLKVK